MGKAVRGVEEIKTEL